MFKAIIHLSSQCELMDLAFNIQNCTTGQVIIKHSVAWSWQIGWFYEKLENKLYINWHDLMHLFIN